MSDDQPRIRVEHPIPAVARLVLARPEKRNAQDPTMLYELDDALMGAAADINIRVIILAADGPDFSAGHDLKSGFWMPRPPVATMESGFTIGGEESQFAFEQEAYLGLCRRWRELPKPTIAQVQGRCIAGGLMLIWPMDLIVASESATFTDPSVLFDMNGVEYFVHAWEVGPRKAKEMLFTGQPISADMAHQLGMVNQVAPESELAEQTLQLAEIIATKSPFGLRLIKQSVNKSIDAQGQPSAIDTAFCLHHVGHANNLAKYGKIFDPDAPARVRTTIRGTARTPR